MNLKSIIFGADEAEGVKYGITSNTREWLPIKQIRDGIVQLKDGRFIKLVEVTPVNFYLKSCREQDQIISSFAAYLKIAPDNLQIRVLTQKADLPNEECLISLRGQKPMRLFKIIPDELPNFGKLRTVCVADYMPAWRKQRLSSGNRKTAKPVEKPPASSGSGSANGTVGFKDARGGNAP